jgi:hypothetical protein
MSVYRVGSERLHEILHSFSGRYTKRLTTIIEIYREKRLKLSNEH